MNSEISEGVAEDFRQALLDLTLNSRYEISNLTVIARENTEHAYAISEALKTHIKQTSSQKKLPAFYVLDSIVKNVGTPYTIFLSRGLYATFMEAYASVDTVVRRKMDEMLKTWKEPVPGALDSRPVFPRDVTSPIENALIKAKTSAVQAHNEYLRSRQQQQDRGRPSASALPHRETPTPPNYRQQPPPSNVPPPQNNYRPPPPAPMPTPPTMYRPPPATVLPIPPVAYGQPPVQPAIPNNSNPLPTQLPPSMLLELLRATGRLPAVPPTAPPVTSTPPFPGNALPGFPPSFVIPPPTHVSTPPVARTPPFQNATPVPRTALVELPNDVVFSDPHSLKLPRPHLISRLYEKLGTACTQCGRRFQSDEAGRKKKADHMDWHFKVHQRMREAEKNGQHRSLYDWIKSREVEGDSVTVPNEGLNGSGIASSSVDSKPELQYLPVPDDPALASSHCPICQEKFEPKWLYNADEFVWMDARKVGDRIFHASCYAEATKDLSSILKKATPEPAGILGKRKAEDDQVAYRSKIKIEPTS
ncbi:hypothetical protein HYALB_00005618 [Hymenoscyphus albidus]|uniref:CID domain-containing protein n=1 Tax=Hymenoscyphus albidus TaxID=595503 RepID=A0A9N9LLZ6_9HELO|nr:hypothetical protein HYALB_00005618 [Hymenoscyphus albidus]